ncbi:hypothetical protein BS47DRAFT_1365140 [Hydnum rufescens UP504]|uniref:Uncharacterized protein n=1 Tax=Hydnum rufescens UP504 TaxID=1448309 RepID=A0A9P6AQ51_9AGAM|nr:hypothetical protein BS47DRAFT_1365140 [Hydnum rufescens UP504]
MSIYLHRAWALFNNRQLPALSRLLPKPQQAAAWKGKQTTTHPQWWVCGHKPRPTHDDNPQNGESPSGNMIHGNALNSSAPTTQHTAARQQRNIQQRANNTTYSIAPNEDATHGNAPNEPQEPHTHCGGYDDNPQNDKSNATRQHNAATQRGNAIDGNTTQQRDPMATRQRRAQNHTPAMAGVRFYIRSQHPQQTNTEAKPPPPPFLTPEQRAPIRTPIRTSESTRPQYPTPLQRVWGTTRNETAKAHMNETMSDSPLRDHPNGTQAPTGVNSSYTCTRTAASEAALLGHRVSPTGGPWAAWGGPLIVLQGPQGPPGKNI